MMATLRNVILAMLLTSCANNNMTPDQEAAIATTATNIARIAAGAAATYYGGPEAGAMAGAGLDALGTVIQSYVGHPIPPAIVTASPGVQGVGPALVAIVAPNRKITQADADKVAQAAAIATAMKPTRFTPPNR